MIASPNELIYFIELSQTLNFSRASERLGISQPTLSAAIKKLEHSLDVELFIRNKHKVILTQAGKNLLSHANTLLQLWNATKTKCQASAEKVQGNVSLGCHSSVALYFLPTFLPDFLIEHPKLDIQLKHDLSRKIVEAVINFNIDVGIVVNPIKHPDLVIVKLFNDEVTFWQANKFQSDALETQLIICDPDLAQTQWLLKTPQMKGMKYRVISSSNLELIASLTATGVGMGVLPQCVVNAMYPDKLIKTPNFPTFNDEICLVYRHENRDFKAIQVLIQAIKKAR